MAVNRCFESFDNSKITKISIRSNGINPQWMVWNENSYFFLLFEVVDRIMK